MSLQQLLLSMSAAETRLTFGSAPSLKAKEPTAFDLRLPGKANLDTLSVKFNREQASCRLLLLSGLFKTFKSQTRGISKG